jgi:hypothetical protein
VIEEERVQVILNQRAQNPYLIASGLADTSTPMQWFGNKKLVIGFA